MCVFVCVGGKNDSADLDVWGLREQEGQEFCVAAGKENHASTRYVAGVSMAARVCVNVFE